MDRNCARLLATLLTFALLLSTGCTGTSGGSGSDDEGIPESVEMRRVDGDPSVLPLAPAGLSSESASCPPGSVIKRVDAFRAPFGGAIVGIDLGCSELKLVEEDAVLRIEFEPIETLARLGTGGIAGGSLTGLLCYNNRVATHIAARVSNDASARLIGVDLECTPLFLVGAGTGIEPALGTPSLQSAGSPGGVDTMAVSCLDPAVDARGALATGVRIYESATELGALVPRCRRPAIDF